MDLDAISIFITAAVCSAIFALVKSSAKKQNKNMTINNFEIIYSPALIRTSYFFAIFYYSFFQYGYIHILLKIVILMLFIQYLYV